MIFQWLNFQPAMPYWPMQKDVPTVPFNTWAFRPMAIKADGFACCCPRCKNQKSIREGSFFMKSRLPLKLCRGMSLKICNAMAEHQQVRILTFHIFKQNFWKYCWQQCGLISCVINFVLLINSYCFPCTFSVIWKNIMCFHFFWIAHVCACIRVCVCCVVCACTH